MKAFLKQKRKFIVGTIIGVLLFLLAYFTLPGGAIYLNTGLILVSVLWYSNTVREDALSKSEKNIVLILIFLIPLIIFKVVNSKARVIENFSIFMGIACGIGILINTFKK